MFKGAADFEFMQPRPACAGDGAPFLPVSAEDRSVLHLGINQPWLADTTERCIDKRVCRAQRIGRSRGKDKILTLGNGDKLCGLFVAHGERLFAIDVLASLKRLL
jgi:hypothetical protein